MWKAVFVSLSATCMVYRASLVSRVPTGAVFGCRFSFKRACVLYFAVATGMCWRFAFVLCLQSLLLQHHISKIYDVIISFPVQSSLLLPSCPFFVSCSKHNPDTTFLIHESVHRYVTVLRHYPRSEGLGLAIQLALPDMPPLVIINIHGPFEKAQLHAMDK